MNLMHPDLLRKFKNAKTKEEFILPYISTFEELLETETFFTLVSILIYNKDLDTKTGIEKLDEFIKDGKLRDDIVHAYHKSKHRINRATFLNHLEQIKIIYSFF